MNKFKGYLICTDCDGTLTDNEGKVSDANAEAIKYFEKEGGLFTLSTGRFPHFANNFKDKFKVNAPIVSLNGAVLYDINAEKMLNSWKMEKERFAKVLRYVNEEWPQIWEIWTSGNIYESVGYKPAEHKYDENSLEEYITKLPDYLYKNLFIQPADVTKKLQEQLKIRFGDKFRFDLSWPEGIEMQSIDSGKGIAIKYLKEHLGKENGNTIHTTIGIGDNENDINMIECSDIGYAVGNAVKELKEKADRITVANTEDAIAKIISQL